MMDKLIEQLVKHEGERLKPYRCTAGKLSIGVGRNLDDKGISKAESRMLLAADIMQCEEDLKIIFRDQWNWISENRKIALTDMRFNLGGAGFRSFKRMINAIKNEDWEQAGLEATRSKWAEQVQKDRSGKIFTQIVGG